MKRAVIPVHGWKWALGSAWENLSVAFSGRPAMTLGAGYMRREARRCKRWRNAEVSDFAWRSRDGHFAPSVRVARGRAARRFRQEAQRLHENGCGQIDVVAHSLGVQVAWSGLRRMGPKERRRIGNVYLFAGAMQAFRSWWCVATGISGRLFNFASCHDRWLRDGYQKANLKGQGRAVGIANATSSSRRLKGIHTCLRNVCNIDRSAAGAGHGSYDIPKCVDEVSEDATETPQAPRGDWRDEFLWDPAPRFPATRVRWKIRGALTEVVQRALSAVYPHSHPGMSPLDIDGAPGPRTRRVLKRFQRRSGNKPDGIVGRKTWEALVGEPASFS